MEHHLLFRLRGQKRLKLFEAVIDENSAVFEHFCWDAITDRLHDFIFLTCELDLLFDEGRTCRILFAAQLVHAFGIFLAEDLHEAFIHKIGIERMKHFGFQIFAFDGQLI
ncbi:hypothetical protein [Shimia sp. R9_2]|uniref:hypothetical protein n=1 Tax=Shimia sp. R9_2 TaxID=2821112 RepID=UPI0032AF13C7